MSEKKLNARQLKFVECYNGNATEAARQAGYKGSDNVLGVTGHDLLRIPKIAELIRERDQHKSEKLIATREQRQKFWTQVMEDDQVEFRDRLSASKLLGLSQGDFVTKTEISGANGEPIKISNDEAADKLSAILEAVKSRKK